MSCNLLDRAFCSNHARELYTASQSALPCPAKYMELSCLSLFQIAKSIFHNLSGSEKHCTRKVCDLFAWNMHAHLQNRLYFAAAQRAWQYCAILCSNHMTVQLYALKDWTSVWVLWNYERFETLRVQNTGCVSQHVEFRLGSKLLLIKRKMCPTCPYSRPASNESIFCYLPRRRRKQKTTWHAHQNI